MWLVFVGLGELDWLRVGWGLEVGWMFLEVWKEFVVCWGVGVYRFEGGWEFYDLYIWCFIVFGV